MTGPGVGRLLCVGGPPGAGKTTVGALVARSAAAVLVDLDAVTTPLVEAVAEQLGVPGDLDSPRLAALRGARYRCLGAVVGDNLRVGLDVVAVAPFTTEARDAAAWRAWGSDLGASAVRTCWLDLGPEAAAARARARGLPRDLATGARARASADVDRSGLDLVVDATPPAEAVAAVVLSGWPTP